MKYSARIVGDTVSETRQPKNLESRISNRFKMLSSLRRWFGIVFICLSATMAASYSSILHAQVDSTAPTDALSFKLGETDLFPSIRIDYSQNSNAFLKPENPVSASEVTISPELLWFADRRLLELTGRYRGIYNISEQEELSFDDHLFAFESNAQLSTRKRLQGSFSINFSHEEMGRNLTRATANVGSRPVEYVDSEAEGVFRYGADGARGNVDLGLYVRNLQYTSRKDVTSGRSFSSIEPYAEFSYRLSGDTRAVTELRFASNKFDDKRRDRNDISMFLGMTFAATGKSGGEFRVGVVQGNAVEATTPDETEFVARAALFWEPTKFSKVTLEGTRELYNEGSSLVDLGTTVGLLNTVLVDWTHEWSSRFSHLASVRVENYITACPERDGDLVVASIEFNLQILRWMSAGVSGSSNTQTYSTCGEPDEEDVDFERTRVGVHLRATL